jgi:hypothetical protein
MKSIFLFAALALALPLTAQNVPDTINYQGRITDNTPQQAPLTGTVDMGFELWNCAACSLPVSSRLWVEPSSGGIPVTVNNGLYSVLLGGNGTPLPNGIFLRNSQMWLQIYVNGEALSPRQEISAAAFAKQSQHAENATFAADATSAVNSSQLGGVPAAGWQRALSTNSCAQGQAFVSIAADGSATCGDTSTVAPLGLSMVDNAGPVLIVNSAGNSPATTMTVDTSGTASAAQFTASNFANTTPAVLVKSSGSGPALRALALGTGSAADFQVTASGDTANAVTGITYGLGRTASLTINNATNNNAVLGLSSNGTGDAESIFANGSGGGLRATVAGNAYAGYFYSTSASGSIATLSARSDGNGGAVVGLVNGASGAAGSFQIQNIANSQYAIYGQTSGTGNAGSFVVSNAANSANVVIATTSGTGDGFHGVAIAGDGVSGQSINGNGVSGVTTSGNGVYGTSANNVGVYGDATNASGTNYGLYGQSASTSGRGVLGKANAVSGAAYGVIGQSLSPAGAGVRAIGSGSDGTALQLESGAIRVVGAGSSTATPVFKYTNSSSPCSAGPNRATIYSSMTDGKPSALLMVTPIGNAVPAVSVYYDSGAGCGGSSGHWMLQSTNGTAITSQSYFILVFTP